MEKIICIWGDSIAWGAYDEESGGWVERLKKHFWNDENFSSVYNLAIDGDNSTKLLNRIEGEAVSRKPNYIIFAIGINDAQFVRSKNSLRIPIDDFKQNLENLFSIAKKFTDNIIFIGLIQVDESKTNPISWNTDKSYFNINIKLYSTTIEKFCKENKLKFIPLDGVITASDLSDGLHPNSQGHKKIFEKVVKSLD